MSGGFPIDLILFGMVAAFLVLRLRSILGRRTGFERPPQPLQPAAAPPSAQAPAQANPPPTIDAVAEPVPGHATPDIATQAGQALAAMHQQDPNFDAARFLAGAEAAFRLIVAAFADGNRDALRPLLNDDTYKAFDAAIAGRETAGETQKTDIKSIQSIKIDDASLRGVTGVVTVRFVTDQTNITLGPDKTTPVAGTDAVTEITDIWTFERDLTNPDPTWRLVAARNA